MTVCLTREGPTPIWVALLEERRPALRLASERVLEALAGACTDAAGDAFGAAALAAGGSW